MGASVSRSSTTPDIGMMARAFPITWPRHFDAYCGDASGWLDSEKLRKLRMFFGVSKFNVF